MVLTGEGNNCQQKCSPISFLSFYLLQTIKCTCQYYQQQFPIPRLKAYALFNINCSGCRARFAEKFLEEVVRKFDPVMKPETIPGCVQLHVCRAVMHSCSGCGTQWKNRVSLLICCFALHGSATQYFSTSPFQAVPFCVPFCNSHQI